jgi:tetratricopeptide (TPR) repeat protein
MESRHQEDLHELAQAHFKSGNYADAEKCLLELLHRDFAHVDAYRLLVETELRRQHLSRATLTLQRLLELSPSDAGGWARLGSLTAMQGHWNVSGRAFETAYEIRKNQPKWLCSAFISYVSGQLEENAASIVARLQRSHENDANRFLVEGFDHKARGRFDRALDCFRRALALDNMLYVAIFNIADLTALPFEEDFAALLTRSWADPSLSPEGRINVGFALARHHESQGRFAEAYDCIASAKGVLRAHLARHGLVYDRERAEREVARVKESIDATTVSEGATQAKLAGGPRRIVILGMPRAGTTLVERILGSHPDVAIGGESPAGIDCYKAFMQERTRRGCGGPIRPSGSADGALLRDAASRLLSATRSKHIAHAAFVTDKSLANVELAGFLKLLSPDSLLVHVTRDPMANCWSLFASLFTLHEPYYCSLEDIAHRFQCYRALLKHWDALFAESIIAVSYEHLVTDPDAAIAKLLEACGLGWDEHCSRFHENPEAVYSHNMVMTRQPITSESLHRWRNYAAFIAPVRTLVEDG